MTSTSGLGTTTITLQFDLDRNIDGAAEDVQTAINAAGGLLPKNLPNPPTYRKTNPADRAILIYAVYSDAMPTLSRSTTTPTRSWRRCSRGRRRLAGAASPASRARRACPGDPMALAARASASRTCAPRSSRALGRPAERQSRRPQQRNYTLDTNDQLFDAARLQEYHRRLSQRRAGTDEGYRRRHQFLAAAAHRRLVRQQPAEFLLIQRAARRQHDHSSSTRSKR